MNRSALQIAKVCGAVWIEDWRCIKNHISPNRLRENYCNLPDSSEFSEKLRFQILDKQDILQRTSWKDLNTRLVPWYTNLTTTISWKMFIWGKRLYLYAECSTVPSSIHWGRHLLKITKRPIPKEVITIGHGPTRRNYNIYLHFMFILKNEL